MQRPRARKREAEFRERLEQQAGAIHARQKDESRGRHSKTYRGASEGGFQVEGLPVVPSAVFEICASAFRIDKWRTVFPRPPKR